ncbi:MAG: hypothetical protein D8H92_13925 [Campylobacter sp.]|nr:MAG: hypothetical protein D8H92_13925 [Campylobacter sp.]
MKQKDFVIAAIRELGGAATLSQLYATKDVSSWQTKTPFASIRRIVQENSDFLVSSSRLELNKNSFLTI